MKILEKAWRWFTLTDAPTQRSLEPTYVDVGPGTCSFCSGTVIQVRTDVTINGKRYNVALCSDHSDVKWWVLL